MKYQVITNVEENGKIIHKIGQTIELDPKAKLTQKWLDSFTIKPLSETETETEPETETTPAKPKK